MNTSTKTVAFSLLPFIVLLCGIAFSYEPVEEVGSTTNLGLGVGYRNGIYKGADDQVFPVPLIVLERGDFYLKGTLAGYRFFKQDNLSLDVIAQWRFDGYDEDDSLFLAGMGDREMNIEGGLGLTYFDGWGLWRLSFVSDLRGEYDGQQTAFSYSKQFTRNRWSFLPTAGFLWDSSNLTNYYYGVEPKYARPWRPAYSVGEAWNPFVSLLTNYQLNEKWSAMALVRYEFFDSEISDSPIVDDDYKLTFLAGLMYPF